MIHPKKPKVLEVIVNSLQDALEAEAGGADRLEVVRNLEDGGLTPDLELVRQVFAAVQIPIRVMLRENSSMQVANPAELDILCQRATQFSSLGVDGLVAGFIKDDRIDLLALHAITQAAPQMNVTFHRAFDELSDPPKAIGILKTVPQVDRILTVGESSGRSNTWPDRKMRLHHWQSCAAPEITILAGAGMLEAVIRDLLQDPQIHEVHIGRAARIPPQTNGVVSRIEVARIKGLA